MNMKFTFYILATVCLLLVVVGCSTQPESVLSTPQVIPELAEDYPTILTPAKNPTQVSTVDATPADMLTSPNNVLGDDTENDGMATATPSEVMTPDGNIYLRTSTGMSRFSLATEEIEILVSTEPDWDSLGLTLSPDRQQLAYWLHAAEHSELWISELDQWSPELVFAVSGIEHEWIGLWWLNERYLLLEPGYIDQRYNFFIPIKAYLINIPRQSIEVETRSLIFGCSLAASPQSALIATWCPAIEDWADPQSYFTTLPSFYVVLEADGEYWLSDLAPEEMFIEFRSLPEDIWSWSYQGTYAAFSTYDEVAKESTLYYIDAQGQSLIAVEDDSQSYQSLDWSPDQKYLSFAGHCSIKGCNKVFDIRQQQVVWTSEGLPGAENGTYLNWSYDSNYIIVQSAGLTIIDIRTGERLRSFQDIEGSVIVWAP